MDLYILNRNLDAITLIDSYTSLIWTDRYYEYGDFELYMPMSASLLDSIKQDHYIWCQKSEHVMIIEKILINSNAEDGDYVTVSGRSLESILDRRVVWGLKQLSGSLQEGIKTLLNESIISPSKETRKIDNFIFEESTDPVITELTAEKQYTGDNVYEAIRDLCISNNIGFKVTLDDNKQFVFKLYSGSDRSYDQIENPYVIFSPNFENLVDSNYMESKSSLKNVTLVGGEGEGTARRYTGVGDVSGLDRREIFTDARDISSEITEDFKSQIDMEQYPNEVYDSTTGTFVSSSLFDSFIIDLRRYTYRTMRLSIPKYTNISGLAPGFATLFVGPEKQPQDILKVWDNAGEGVEYADTGDLETYEFEIPRFSEYLYTSMFVPEHCGSGELYPGSYDDFTCETIKLGSEEYIGLLYQRGKETLSENKEIVSFEGEAETTNLFVYGKDFFMGDVVQVADSYGHSTKSRVLEIVISENEQGSTTYPTFLTITEEGESTE